MAASQQQTSQARPCAHSDGQHVGCPLRSCVQQGSQGTSSQAWAQARPLTGHGPACAAPPPCRRRCLPSSSACWRSRGSTAGACACTSASPTLCLPSTPSRWGQELAGCWAGPAAWPALQPPCFCGRALASLPCIVLSAGRSPPAPARHCPSNPLRPPPPPPAVPGGRGGARPDAAPGQPAAVARAQPRQVAARAARSAAGGWMRGLVGVHCCMYTVHVCFHVQDCQQHQRLPDLVSCMPHALPLAPPPHATPWPAASQALEASGQA